jgi:hypothetical protein
MTTYCKIEEREERDIRVGDVARLECRCRSIDLDFKSCEKWPCCGTPSGVRHTDACEVKRG